MNSQWMPYKAWIVGVLDSKGWSPTEWCTRAGLSPSTLLRPLNNTKHMMGPSLTTLRALAQAADVPLPYVEVERDRMTKASGRRGHRQSVTQREEEREHVITIEVRIPKFS